MASKLVALDRDGVINYESDHYIRNVDQWHPIPGSLEAIARLSKAGFKVAVATNQSGLGRGLLDQVSLDAIHAELQQRVEQLGGQLEGVFYCPHRPEENCRCRKPQPGLLKAIERHTGMSIAGCPFIGDSARDLEAAERAGCIPMLVRTGRGDQTLKELQSEPVRHPELLIFPDLAHAVTAILSPSQ